jgi:hypothetical protein
MTQIRDNGHCDQSPPYLFHSLASVFPLMEGHQFNELAEKMSLPTRQPLWFTDRSTLPRHIFARMILGACAPRLTDHSLAVGAQNTVAA